MGTNGTVRDPSSRSDDLNALEARRAAPRRPGKDGSNMILGIAGLVGIVLALELAFAGVDLGFAGSIAGIGAILLLAGIVNAAA